MAITNPLHQLPKDFAEQLREQMRRMLARLEEMRAMALSSSANVAWAPPVDVCEMEDAVLVRVEAPGVSSEHVRVALLDNVLKIECRKERPNFTGGLLPEEERPIRFICLERTFGGFTFSLPLKWLIDAPNISARLTNGVLQIRMPKIGSGEREVTIPVSDY
ncbi:MAG TPA: Hsp20/alpha crystallin family protein [Blastocatellia bacterium]|nr:Hsp20/alpha crystallin family protein [Blastocatellia bacterium]